MARNYPADITRGGVGYRFCSQCETWKTRSGNFKFDRKRLLWHRACKACRRAKDHKRRTPHLEVSGRVPLANMTPHLNYMVGAIGYTQTAIRLGVSRGTLARWRGSPYRGRPLRHVLAKTAARILRATARLREDVAAGKVIPIENHQSKGLCKGCGGDLETYMDGCRICWDRRRARKRREDAEFRKAENAKANEKNKRRRAA